MPHYFIILSLRQPVYLPFYILRNGIEQVAFWAGFRAAAFLADLDAHFFDLFFQLARGEEAAALAADDDLFQVVGGGYSDAVFSAVLMGEFFDVLVGCLGFFGVDYVDVMVVQDFGFVLFCFAFVLFFSRQGFSV